MGIAPDIFGPETPWVDEWEFVWIFTVDYAVDNFGSMLYAPKPTYMFIHFQHPCDFEEGEG